MSSCFTQQEGTNTQSAGHHYFVGLLTHHKTPRTGFRQQSAAGALTSKHELGKNALDGVRLVLDGVVVIGNHEKVDRADNLLCSPETTDKEEGGSRSRCWEWLAQTGDARWGVKPSSTYCVCFVTSSPL